MAASNRLAAAFVGAVAALAGGLGAVAPAAATGCTPAGASVLENSGAAQLYSSGGDLYGCAGARTTRLGVLSVGGHFAQTRVAHYALAGHYAGIDLADMGIDTFSSQVSVYDLDSGRRTATAPATSPENRAESFITVSSLVIDPAGTLAWVGRRSAVGAFTPIYEVRTLGASRDRLLDTSTRIEASSLALRGHALSWLDGTSRRHASLEP
jgi:hypothetical protein